MARAPGKHAFAFVLITVFLDMVGFGLIIRVLPALIEDVGKVGLAQAAVIGGWMFFAFSMAQFLCAPLMGNLSDRGGRRPLLLLAIFGLWAGGGLGAVVVHGPEGFVQPMLMAMMSRVVPEDAQGELQGGISAVTNIAMLAGTVTFSQVFAAFMAPDARWQTPDAAYFLAAAALAVALMTRLRVLARLRADRLR